MANKSSLENVLKAVLSVGNAEQNFAYAPYVFDAHYNIATSFILDQLVISYPLYIDALTPFMKKEVKAVSGGYADLPEDFRNLLGAPSISLKPDGTDCSSGPVIDTKREFESAKLKAGCRTVPIEIVTKKDWDYRTTSTYAFPTLDNPIGIYEGKKIKVCPYDISHVTFLYIKKEKIYRYGYIVQPDDTFLYDQASSVETEWEEPAFELLFKAVSSLYAAYSRDKSLTDWTAILSKIGLF